MTTFDFIDKWRFRGAALNGCIILQRRQRRPTPFPGEFEKHWTDASASDLADYYKDLNSIKEAT